MSEPRTINLPGSGTDTQQYELAPGLLQYVQAVRVTIDNSGGADTHPVLSIAEQSGVVIADAPQNGTIPAGESDAASTWALRLLDESGGAATAPLELVFTALGMQSQGEFEDTRPFSTDLANIDSILVSLSETGKMFAGNSFTVTAGNKTSANRAASVFNGLITRFSTAETERFSGAAIALNPGDFTDISLAHVSGTAILSYTNAAAPTVPATDIYAIDVQVTWG